MLDEALELFKQRCTHEAEWLRCEAAVSFEALTREIDDFPTRVQIGSTWYVNTWGQNEWGDDMCAECWFHATRGIHAPMLPGLPVPFAEVLQSMFPKFLDRVMSLGFATCGRVPGTWMVHVSWDRPELPAGPCTPPMALER